MNCSEIGPIASAIAAKEEKAPCILPCSSSFAWFDLMETRTGNPIFVSSDIHRAAVTVSLEEAIP